MVEIHPKLDVEILQYTGKVDADFLVCNLKSSEAALYDIDRLSSAGEFGALYAFMSDYDGVHYLLNNFGPNYIYFQKATMENIINFRPITKIFQEKVFEKHRNLMIRSFNQINPNAGNAIPNTLRTAAAVTLAALACQETIKYISRTGIPIDNLMAINVRDLRNVIARI